MDRRKRKSQNAIETAFWQLWQEIPFSELTVTAIIDKADVNRSTFYAHYQDKLDLLEQMEDRILMGFYTILQNHLPLPHSEQKEEFIKNYAKDISRYLQKNKLQITLILSERDEFLFQSKFQKLFLRVWQEIDLVHSMKIPTKYAQAIFPVMISQIIIEWSKSSNESITELEQVLETILNMINDHLI